mmetsp:Transcript_26124/g.53893  ORF Transcript_26124/g.53893 Transcript_26124/m.53893 type:complete len:87 (-) Transcript_26124:680-940(-)
MLSSGGVEDEDGFVDSCAGVNRGRCSSRRVHRPARSATPPAFTEPTPPPLAPPPMPPAPNPSEPEPKPNSLSTNPLPPTINNPAAN